MSDDRTDGSVPVETRRRSLTLAVRLVDAFTEDRPSIAYGQPTAGAEDERWRSGRPSATRYPRVSLRIGNSVASPVRNASGFDLFLDVAIPDDAMPTLEVEGGPHYVDETLPVASESLSPLRRRTPDVVSGHESETRDLLQVLDDVQRWRDTSPTYQEIRLRPSPAYRFPPGATLLRGRVQNSDGEPLPDVTLTIDGPARTTETTREGEFVLYFTKLTDDNVTEDGLVQVDDGDPRIQVEHVPDDPDTTESLGTDTVTLPTEEGRARVYALEFEGRNSVTAIDVTPRG